MLLASPHFVSGVIEENRDLAMRILDLFSGLERDLRQSSANISL
jgi:hypothetical protein